MDRLAAMRVFVEIVDRGSLTAAADALDRSQPTIVRSLASLESHLGAQLLRRTTRRMSLTPEGRDFLERCRRILADVEDAERAVGREAGEPRGDLRMTAPVEFGRLHIAPLMSGFLARYEQVTCELLLLDRVVDLVEEGIDLALRIGHLADSSLVATRVASVRRVVCASPKLVTRLGVPDHPDELKSLPCIRQQNPTPGSAWAFRDGKRTLRVPVQGRFSTNQIAAAVSACADGSGFARFLSYQVQDRLRRGDLQLVLENFEPEPWPVSLVYPGGRIVSARLRVMIDWLKRGLSKSVPAN